MKSASVGVGQAILTWIQEEVVGQLVAGQARAHWGCHVVKGSRGKTCSCNQFVRRGYRQKARKVKTDIGALQLPLQRVQCCQCGKKFTPILEVLRIGKYQRHSASLEQVALEAVSETSYRRGSADVEARGCAPVPRSSAHRWAVSRAIPEAPEDELQSGMADATGFKKWPKEKGEVRVVIGLTPEGKVRRLGTYAGRDWEQIAAEVRQKLADVPGQLELFAHDGDRYVEKHLAGIAEHAQRCTWHVPRGAGHVLWKEGMSLQERKAVGKNLTGLLAVEIPGKDWERVSEEDKKELRDKIAQSEKALSALASDFRARNYVKAAAYLESAGDRVFEHLRLWLRTGIIAPRTISILESIMREIGRRLKRIAWNWSDRGAEQIARMVLMRHYEPEEWEAFWNEILDLQDRIQIRVLSVQREAA
jgi:hypothetical protein